MEPRQHLSTSYFYELPPGRIAEHPKPLRDSARLLISDGTSIQEDVFSNVPHLLPTGSLLVLNDTRVVYARLLFRKSTGARIEVFCLEPVWPEREIQAAFTHASGVVWKCLIGNARRWKSERLRLGQDHIVLTAIREDRLNTDAHVRFEWEPKDLTFSQILEYLGRVPLPPYIQREPIAEDGNRYQTLYAQNEGSVAAPTAGLHFTEDVFRKLKGEGVDTARLTLHVGAGTFRPVVTKTIGEHEMHREEVHIDKQTVRKLLNHQGPIIAVGTTTVRLLESLYWYGVSILLGIDKPFFVGQWEPYHQIDTLPGREQALQAVLAKFDDKGDEILRGSTQLIIVPGYTYRMIHGMITNFHQPGSTLLMLVAAFIGEHWKEVYQYALEKGFRFLSYGDACLFLPKPLFPPSSGQK